MTKMRRNSRTARAMLWRAAALTLILAAMPAAAAVAPAYPTKPIRIIVLNSPGSGSSGHLAAEVFRSMTGINITHVPYKGAAPALTDTMGGQVQLTFFVAPLVIPVIKAGKVRALGVSSLKRTPLAPDLPTIAESVPGYEWSGWYGLVAPAGTPGEITVKLNAVQIDALKTAEFRERLLGPGVNPLGTTPQEYASFMRVQVEKMREAIRMSGARAG